MTSFPEQLLILVNPESGDKQNVIDVSAFVLPLLSKVKDLRYQLRITDSVENVGELAKEFIASGVGRSILVAGGDGIIHEVVNALTTASQTDSSSKDLITLAIWPGGTANALFASLYASTSPNPEHARFLPADVQANTQVAYKLKSVLAFLHSRTAHDTPSRPLTIASTELYKPDGTRSDGLLSVVVASTSMHAALLHAAEGLRDRIPGLQRFQEAARMTMAEWSTSSATIHGPIQQYDADQDALLPIEEDELHLEGPFAYFLSTVNVDRLEPTFYITAPHTTHAPEPGSASIDIVVIRPHRSKTHRDQGDDAEVKAAFGKGVLLSALQAAYDKGSHVKQVYPDSEDTVVEYFRAKGWEWKPNAEDMQSRLVCADGTLKTIPVGGRAICKVLSESDGVPNFRIFLSEAPKPPVAT